MAGGRCHKCTQKKKKKKKKNMTTMMIMMMIFLGYGEFKSCRVLLVGTVKNHFVSEKYKSNTDFATTLEVPPDSRNVDQPHTTHFIGRIRPISENSISGM